jgi:uncharacterized protein (TIGR00288 family)
MSLQANNNIALFIDADNAPASKIEFIIAELATIGRINIRRAYGNWKKSSLSGWEKILPEHAIQPIQQFDIVKGKNATDMALLIDAMDMLYTKDIDTFCLVSSDCDFTPLVLRLRAEGKKVIGFGRKSTPDPFVNACSRFIYLDEEKPEINKSEQKELSVQQLKQNTKLMDTLRHAIKATCDDDGWAGFGPIGSYIANKSPFDHRTFGFKKLSDLFAAIDLFEIKKFTDGANSFFRVRLKKKEPAKKAVKKTTKKTTKKAAKKATKKVASSSNQTS